MAKEEAILRFDKVSFEYGHNKPILDGVSFPHDAVLKSRLWDKMVLEKVLCLALSLEH